MKVGPGFSSLILLFALRTPRRKGTDYAVNAGSQEQVASTCSRTRALQASPSEDMGSFSTTSSPFAVTLSAQSRSRIVICSFFHSVNDQNNQCLRCLILLSHNLTRSDLVQVGVGFNDSKANIVSDNVHNSSLGSSVMTNNPPPPFFKSFSKHISYKFRGILSLLFVSTQMVLTLVVVRPLENVTRNSSALGLTPCDSRSNRLFSYRTMKPGRTQQKRTNSVQIGQSRHTLDA